ncbi:MAG: glycoside hydrolase [Ginsengibacter sp.]
MMRKLTFIVSFLLIIFNSFTCVKTKAKGSGSESDSSHPDNPLIVVDIKNEKQTIENFGASDCWTTKFIGKWTNTVKKNLIADYLFSMDTTARGNPKGIGLSLWRFNIGAGSFEQGPTCKIPDEFRREECFLNPNGMYDWTKQAGQQWFLNGAKQRGVNNFLAFSNSPPVQFTINGEAYGSGTSQFNLKPGSENDFADFLVNVVEHFNQEGFNMRYVSPVNEPQWNWGDKKISQEGSGATNAEIANFVKLLGPKLKAANSITRIALGEAAQWNFLYAEHDNRGKQLNDFFNPVSSNYIGNVPNVDNIFSAHSYFTSCPDDSLIKIRQDAFNTKNQVSPSLKLWQTEFGILGNICGKYNGYPKNTGIDYGLYVAKVIYDDLAIANVSAWQWWLAVDTYNYSDGLVYINDPAGGYDLNAMKTDGIVSDSKQLWCLGNYSRFVRPGMIRVEASLNTIADDTAAASSQMITAYKNPANNQLVMVIVNMETIGKEFSIDPSKLKLTNDQMAVYTTDATHNLGKSIVNSNSVIIPAKSVVTLVGNYK